MSFYVDWLTIISTNLLILALFILVALGVSQFVGVVSWIFTKDKNKIRIIKRVIFVIIILAEVLWVHGYVQRNIGNCPRRDLDRIPTNTVE